MSYISSKLTEKWQQQWIIWWHFIRMTNVRHQVRVFITFLKVSLHPHSQMQWIRPLLAMSVKGSVCRHLLLFQESQFESMFCFKWCIFASAASWLTTELKKERMWSGERHETLRGSKCQTERLFIVSIVTLSRWRLMTADAQKAHLELAFYCSGKKKQSLSLFLSLCRNSEQTQRRKK